MKGYDLIVFDWDGTILIPGAIVGAIQAACRDLDLPVRNIHRPSSSGSVWAMPSGGRSASGGGAVSGHGGAIGSTTYPPTTNLSFSLEFANFWRSCAAPGRIWR